MKVSAKTKYKVTKSMLLVAILCTSLLAGFIVLVAFFGSYMGTFVISLSDDTVDLGISLSENSSFVDSSSRLFVNPLVSASPTSFINVDFEEGVQIDGNIPDEEKKNYIGYSFYIRNTGNIAVNVALSLETVKVKRNVDDAVRIAIIEDGVVDEDSNLSSRSSKLFIKEGKNKDERTCSLMISDELARYESFEKAYFDDKFLGEYIIENFKPGDVHKYTLFIWLEGWDLDCNDDIKDGQLKMKMSFDIIDIYEEDGDDVM